MHAPHLLYVALLFCFVSSLSSFAVSLLFFLLTQGRSYYYIYSRGCPGTHNPLACRIIDMGRHAQFGDSIGFSNRKHSIAAMEASRCSSCLSSQHTFRSALVLYAFIHRARPLPSRFFGLVFALLQLLLFRIPARVSWDPFPARSFLDPQFDFVSLPPKAGNLGAAPLHQAIKLLLYLVSSRGRGLCLVHSLSHHAPGGLIYRQSEHLF